MKTTLLILLSSVIVLNLNAQKIRKDTIKGKNASYYQEIRFGSIKMRNIQNKDTTYLMYYDDGSQVPEGILKSKPMFTMEDGMKIFKDAFTSSELEQLKTTRGAFNIFVAVDKNGNINTAADGHGGVFISMEKEDIIQKTISYKFIKGRGTLSHTLRLRNRKDRCGGVSRFAKQIS